MPHVTSAALTRLWVFVVGLVLAFGAGAMLPSANGLRHAPAPMARAESDGFRIVPPSTPSGRQWRERARGSTNAVDTAEADVDLDDLEGDDAERLHTPGLFGTAAERDGLARRASCPPLRDVEHDPSRHAEGDDGLPRGPPA